MNKIRPDKIYKEVNEFVSNFKDESIWKNYKQRTDYSYYIQDYMPQKINKFSFWELSFKLQKAQKLLEIEKVNTLDNMTKTQN